MSGTPPVPRLADAHNIDHANALSMCTIAVAIVAAFLGSLLEALRAWSVWRITGPDILTKWLVAGLLLIGLVADDDGLFAAAEWENTWV